MAVLYLRRSTRPSTDVKRDDPNVIKARIAGISVVTVISVFVFVPFVLVAEHVYDNWFMAFASLRILWGWKLGNDNDGDAASSGAGLVVNLLITVMGLTFDSLKALLLTSILFLGPLADCLYFSHQEKSYTLGYGPTRATFRILTRDIKDGMSNIFGVRNYIAGPLTEELVFRSGVIALFLASPASRPVLVFVTPLFFGIAHVHHAYELYLDDTDIPPLHILLNTLFQFTFTTIFGWYAAFLFLRLGSVWPPVVVHIFCNSLGPPSFGHVGKNISQTYIYRALLVVGIVGFWQFLGLLTRSGNRIL